MEWLHVLWLYGKKLPLLRSPCDSVIKEVARHTKVCFVWQCICVVMLQADLASGSFTRLIAFAKVDGLVTTTCVVNGIPRSCRAISGLVFGTRLGLTFGTHFCGTHFCG